MNRFLLLVLTASTPLVSTFSGGTLAAAESPEWIWSTVDRQAAQMVSLSRTFDLQRRPISATLRGLGDFAEARFVVNGIEVGAHEPFADPVDIDVLEHLQAGSNTVRIHARSVDGPAAVFAKLELRLDAQNTQVVLSNSKWQVAHLPAWPPQSAIPTNGRSARAQLATDQSSTGTVSPKVAAAVSFGAVAEFPWGRTPRETTIRASDDYTQWKQAQGDAAATSAGAFQLAEGFRIELVRAAAPDEGSWISVAFDPQGRLVIANEEHGLRRLSLDFDNPRVRPVGELETINDQLHECRGLLFVGETLFATANNDHALYRLRDSTGDGNYDEVRQLAELKGDVGHGRNQLTLGPDGRLYVICGDAVFAPETQHSRVPPLAAPNDIETTRSGFVAAVDQDGKNWELITRGLRNPYGIAFNQHGDMFTYDADAEYDMGAPWYRPTRLLHLVPGGDFGWRRVTRRWPPYDPDRPDMPRPTLDIGKGSPTAVRFGTGARFPKPYQDALFIMDWAYGRILAVHLSPRGSSYAAGTEVFLRGQPANVTDLQFGPDGAMYLITGGRGTRSAIYRVTANDNSALEPPTPQQVARSKHAERSRHLRRELERRQIANSIDSIDFAWLRLDHPDPWIRHAARTVLEHQPVEGWAQRALSEPHPRRQIAALLALTRAGSDAYHSDIVSTSLRLSPQDLDEHGRDSLLFVLARLPLTDLLESNERQSLMGLLKEMLVHQQLSTSPELGRLLCDWDPRTLINQASRELAAATTQHDQMHLLHVLSMCDGPRTAEQQTLMLTRLAEMQDYVAGDGMPTFRKLIETAAIDRLPDSDRADAREALDQLLAGSHASWLPTEQRDVVREWTAADFTADLVAPGTGRDYERGRKMFREAHCLQCHRVGSEGGLVGPDLSSVGRRFAASDLLTSILDPSRVVAEKYRQSVFVLKDGRVVTGSEAAGGDYRSPTLIIQTDPLDPAKTVEVAKSQIDEQQQSPSSKMPQGLLNNLHRDEILDLLAYLIAGGDATHPLFTDRK